jgi:hypothetical protein
MTGKPWSAERERRLTATKNTAFYVFVLSLAQMIIGAALYKGWLAVWALPAFTASFCVSIWAGSELSAMEPNRPYFGARGLTKWRFWPHHQAEFDCRCGRRLTFAGVAFSPNSVDPGGGRYSLVCFCGQGHYKNGLPAPGASAASGKDAEKKIGFPL